MIKLYTIAFQITIIISHSRIFRHFEAAKILAIVGVPHASENLFGASLLNALSAKGHEIITIEKYAHKLTLNDNVQRIVIEDNDVVAKELILFATANFNASFFHNIESFFAKGAVLSTHIIKNPLVQEFLKLKDFDLIICDTLMAEGLTGLGEYLNASMIAITNFYTPVTMDFLVGNVSPLSVVPSILIQHTFEGKFLQRCLNVALNMIDSLVYHLLHLPHQEKFYEQTFPNASLSFDQAMRNFALVLIHHHFSLSSPRPYVPNVIDVAGLHIEQNDDVVLSADLERFLNDSSRAVVYIRLDIGVNNYNLQLINTTVILRSLEALDYKAIWHMDYMPPEAQAYDNILHITNGSHFSALGHANIKLLLTNGETLSVIEACHYGKPLLGIPIFADHYGNLNMAISGGYGLGITFRGLNEKNLKNKLLELVDNPSYALKIKELSKIFRDQPLNAKDKAVYWVEYILRHKRALHLRSKVRYLNFWQFHNIDVFLAYIVGFAIIVIAICWPMKYLCLLANTRRCRKVLEIKLKEN